MAKLKKAFTIMINKKDLHKTRSGVKVGRIFKDKTKYTRKPKHKKEPKD